MTEETNNKPTSDKTLRNGFIILGILYILVLFMGYFLGTYVMKKDAIKQGYGEYNLTTGKWQWKNNEIQD